MTTSRSEIAQIRRECLAQTGVAAIRRITQQVGPLFCKDLCPKPLPHSYRKFIDRRNTRDKRNARASSCCSKIKLFPHSPVRNCSHPIGNANERFHRRICFRSATASSSRRMARKLIYAQIGVRERICYECARFGL